MREPLDDMPADQAAALTVPTMLRCATLTHAVMICYTDVICTRTGPHTCTHTHTQAASPRPQKQANELRQLVRSDAFPTPAPCISLPPGTLK